MKESVERKSSLSLELQAVHMVIYLAAGGGSIYRVLGSGKWLGCLVKGLKEKDWNIREKKLMLEACG